MHSCSVLMMPNVWALRYNAGLGRVFFLRPARCMYMYTHMCIGGKSRFKLISENAIAQESLAKLLADLVTFLRALVGLQIGTHVHVHRFGLRVGFQSSLSQFSSDAAQLDSCGMLAFKLFMSLLAWVKRTSKRNARVAVLCAVDPDHSSLDLGCHTMSPLQIVGEDRRPEAVTCVVRCVDRLFFVREAGDDDHRT